MVWGYDGAAEDSFETAKENLMTRVSIFID